MGDAFQPFWPPSIHALTPLQPHPAFLHFFPCLPLHPHPTPNCVPGPNSSLATLGAAGDTAELAATA